MTEQVAARRRKPEPQAARVEELSDSEADSFDEAERKVKEIRKQKAAARRRAEEQDDDYTTANLFVDILRVLSFLFLASCGLSYLISNGETFFWGMSNPPKYLRMDWWKRQIVSFGSAHWLTYTPFLTSCDVERPNIPYACRARPI